MADQKNPAAEVWVLGGGPAELAAALELAEVGLSVKVASGEESAAAWAGLPAEGVPDPDGALRAFMTHVAAPIAEGSPAAADAEPVVDERGPVLLRGANGRWAPQPVPSVLGIPAVPVAKESLALLGSGAGMRAYLDRVKPVLTIGKTHGLGALVRSRMGQGALDILVEPFVRERYGVDADRVDVAIAAPGLNEDLTVTGSLSGAALAYAERAEAREARVRPRGGWSALREALVERLGLYAVEFADVTPSAVRREVEGWLVAEPDGSEHAASAVVAAVTPAVLGLPGLGEELAELAPAVERVHAVVPIADPELPEPDGEALDALRIVEVPGSGTWSVRLVRAAGSAGTEPARSIAQVAGPAVPAVPAHPGPRGEAVDPEPVLAAVAAAGLEAAGGAPAERRRTAPFATLAVRDAAAAKLAVWRASRDDALPVGPALHGGALPEAIGDARAAAVALRRRLTGIAE